MFLNINLYLLEKSDFVDTLEVWGMSRYVTDDHLQVMVKKEILTVEV